ncbi:MAG: acyltransferase [Dehalococcoidia bacterium]|nr:acyltransferase [Dehalococcoidia bacterium]
MTAPFVHSTADVSDGATLGEDVRIWHQVQVREGATVGDGCIIGKGVYVGAGVNVGANCKVQNYSCLYEGLTLEDGVFVGPHVVFTNDRFPRAINPDGSIKAESDWDLGRTTVRHGASVGSRAVILAGVTIGRWALVGMGAVVTRDVPDYALVLGNPARVVGRVDEYARRVE